MTLTKATAIATTTVVVMFAVGFFARQTVTSGLVSEAQAQNGPGSRRCSNRTLNGAYGVRFTGEKIGVGPFVSVSRITFDGVGTFTTVESGRFNGNPIQRSFTGPYTVREDCTGFLDFSSNLTDPPHEARGDFVIVEEGREFFVVDNEEGWAASGVGKRL